MPDEAAPAGNKPLSVLSRKVGPFPGYVWVGVIGVPVAAFILLRKRSSAGSADAAGAGMPVYNPAGGGPDTGGGAGGGGSFDPSNLIDAIVKGNQTTTDNLNKGLQEMTAQNAANAQALSTSWTTSFGALSQLIASLRQSTPTPVTNTTSPPYQVPAMLPPQAQITQMPPSYAMTNPYANYAAPRANPNPFGAYNPTNPMSWPAGIYSPGGGYQPLPTYGGQPAPGYGATTYFGGGGDIWRGGVPR